MSPAGLKARVGCPLGAEACMLYVTCSFDSGATPATPLVARMGGHWAMSHVYAWFDYGMAPSKCLTLL